MTLILSLVRPDEAVLSADSEIHSGDNSGLYTSSMPKLKIINDGHWILGVAGTQIGWDLQKHIDALGEKFDHNIHIGIHVYAREMHELYQQHGYVGPTFLLVAGTGDTDVAVYNLNFEGKQFDGASLVFGQKAVGANQHGAMYFATAFHSQGMTTIQRISLAHLCVSEACKQDPRVGFPVEIGLVRFKQSPQIFKAEALKEVQKYNDKIANRIKKMVLSANPTIAGLQ